MLKIESIYFPFVNLIFGTIAGVLLTHLVNTNLGKWSYVLFVLATLGVCSLWRDGWNFFHRMRLHRRSADAYNKVARVYKPQILDPERPGNQDFMKEQAQQAVDDTALLMDRLGLFHPEKIDIHDNDSLALWYECLRPMRRKEY